MTRTKNEIMLDIWDVYCQLSGESLSCDGELSLSAINKKRKPLEARLTKLQKELNKDVSECDAYHWWVDVNTLTPEQCFSLLEKRNQ
jgi:hypothetical protein